MSDDEWRSCEEVKRALDIEGRIIGVTAHRGRIGFKIVNSGTQDIEEDADE